MNSKKQNYVALAFLFIMMILAAIVENTKGIFIPVFKQEFGVNDNTISNMLISTSAAYMVLTFIGGTLCEKLGQKKVFLGGLMVIFLSLIFLSFTENYGMLYTGMVTSSAGIAMVAISCNTVLPIIALTAQNVIMNVMHACYGLGSSVGQGLFGALTARGVNWRTMYFAVGIVYLVVFICFIFVKIPRTEVVKEEDKLSLKEALGNKIIVAYMLALGLYVFTEQGISNWFVNYMKFGFDMNEQKAGLYLSLFFAIFTVGRLFGGFVVEKRGYFNILYKTLIVGAILCIVGLLLGSNGMVVISLSGLFFSITFPTTVLSISKVFDKHVAYITGIVITAASLVGMILNKAIGMLNESIGPDKAFYIIPASAILSAALMFYLYVNTKKKLVK
ncbi:MFS transporter [Clostridium sp. B9]|uniref:MFS transporter n=1 Tax=Clostridium sp. B9 TaxID=3423224 RepID=UPI003D2EDFB3